MPNLSLRVLLLGATGTIGRATAAALMAGGLIAGFVAGVTAGFLVAHAAGRRRQAAGWPVIRR